MPFKSKAQKAWMYANKPKLAEEWSKTYEKNYLPDRLHPKRVRKK
jgi:hypothetical protein|tara:strand:+ start:277 stop:411 length:135 start_codon:yes stop_codon:yes gene_type:complete